MAFVLSLALKASGIQGLDKIEKQINKLSNVTLKISPKLDARQLKSDLKDLGPFYIDVIPRLKKDFKNQTITKTVNVVEKYAPAKQVKRPDLSYIKKELDAIDKSFKTAHSTIHGATESIEDFGTRSAIALKRFLAFGIGTSVIIGFGAAFKTAIQGATEFEKEIAKVAQVTQISLKGISDIRNDITALSSGLGVSSQELAVSAATLAQTGVGLDKVRQSLKAIALARLSPSFGSDKETVEGLIAVFSQFGPAAGDASVILSKINSVSKAYAVESQDLITAVQKSGGAFKQAGGSFEQFLGTITAIRSTTRESADAIATGVRTIISRLQRPKTLDFIEDVLGINLRDPLDSKKTLPIFDVIDKIRTAIKEQNLLSKEGEGPNIKLSQITEEIGGTRQLSRVIPLLNNFEKAVAASNLAIDSADSLTLDAAIAQETLANKVQKTTEEIKRFGDTLLQDSGFQTFSKVVLNIATGIARVGSSLTPLLPLFGSLAAITLKNTLPGFGAGIAKAGIQRFSAIRQSGLTGLAGGGEYFGGSKVHGHNTRNFGGRDTVPALLKPGEVVLNESQQRRIGGVSGLGRNEFFGALGVPGFANGGISGFDKGGQIRGGLFGPKVAARARREAKKNNLYAYDSGQEGYYKVNPDGSLNFQDFVDEQALPVGAKTISHHPYSDEYDAPHIKGSNLLKIKDPKVNKLDELGLSTIAPSFELDPELRRLKGLGSLNAKSLLRASQSKFGKNTLIKTAFGSDLQGLGVFGRPKGGLSTGDAEEIIRRFESGSDSGFFAQKKLPGPYFNELRVHVAVDQNGKVKILSGGTVNKGTLLDPTNKKSIERLVNSGIDEDKAGKVASSFKKAAQVSAFKTIRELVAQKGITNATFGVDVGATRLDDAKESGINTQEFYSGVETKTGTIVFETNPSEASGSSGFFGGFATQDLVKKVFGQKTKKLPAKDKDRILELMAPRMQGPLPLFGPDRSLAPVIPDSISPDEIQSILGVNPDLGKIFKEASATSQLNVAAGIAEPKPLLNFAKSPILNIIGRFLNNKPKSLEGEQNRVFEKLAARSYGDVRRLIGREGGGASYPFDKLKKFNTGGFIPGSGTGDKIPSMLAPGEVVLNQGQQNRLGRIVGTSPRKLFSSIGVPFQDRSGHYAGGVDLGSGSGSVASNKAGFGLLGLGVLANAFADLQGPLKDVADLVTQFAGTTLILNETLSQTPNMLKYNAQLQEVNQEFENSSQKLGAYANEIDKNNKIIAESSTKRRTAEAQVIESQKKLTDIENRRGKINSSGISYAARDQANKALDVEAGKARFQKQRGLDVLNTETPGLVAAKAKNALLKQEAQLVDDVNQRARQNQEIIAGQIKAEERKNKAIQIGIIAAQLGSTLIKKASQGQLEKKKDSYATSSALSSALSLGATGASFGSALGPIGTAVGAVGGALLGAGTGYFGGKQELREARLSSVQNTFDKAASGGELTGDEVSSLGKDIRDLADKTTEYNRYLGNVTTIGRSENNTKLAKKTGDFLRFSAKSIDTEDQAKKFISNNKELFKVRADLLNADVDDIEKAFIKDVTNPLVNIGNTVSKNKDTIFASLEQMNNFLAGIDEAFNQTQQYSDAIAATTGGIKVSDRSSTLKNTSNITSGREFDRQLSAATGNFGAFGGQVKTKVEAAANNAPALRGFISNLKSGNLGLKDQAQGKDVLAEFDKQFKDKFKGAEDLYAQAQNSLVEIIGAGEDTSKIIDRADIDLKSATQAMDSIGESVGQIAATMSKAVLDAQNQYGDALKAAGELYQQGRSKRFEGFDVAAQKVEFQGQFGRTNINSLQNIENSRLGFFAQGNPQQLGGQLRASQDRFEQIQARKEQGVGQAEGDALIKAQTQELDNIARINKQFDLLEDTTSRLNITQLKLNKAQQEQGVRKSIADIENFGSIEERQKLRRTKQNAEDLASGKIKVTDLSREKFKDVADLFEQGGQADVKNVLPGIDPKFGNIASEKVGRFFTQQFDTERRVREGQARPQAAAAANEVYGTPLDQQRLLVEGNNIIQQGQDVKAIRGGNIQDQANKQAQIAGVQYDELFKSFANGIPQLMAGMDNAGQNFGKAADIQLAAANQMKNVAEMMEKNVLGNGEIDLAGKVDLNVNINGGQVLAELTPQINEIVQAKIKESLNDFISKKLPNLGRV